VTLGRVGNIFPERPVEERAQPASRAIADQHVGWTAHHPAGILMRT
jgi:hypothetical protein